MNNEVKSNSGNSSIVVFMILVLPLSFFYSFITGAPFLGVAVGNLFIALAAYSLSKESSFKENAA